DMQPVVEGAVIADFDPGRYKTEGRVDEKHLGAFHVAAADTKENQTALERGRIIGESQNFTRELVNEPGNRMTPTMLADRAKKMCEAVKSPSLKCEVYGADRIRELKMGAFWSVSQGSDEPPALIVMTYTPPGAPEKPVLG